MPTPSPASERTLSLAAELEVPLATEAHDRLLSLLDEAESAECVTVLELDTEAPSSLALQLLISATRSFPVGRLKLGENARASLTAFETPKEN